MQLLELDTVYSYFDLLTRLRLEYNESNLICLIAYCKCIFKSELINLVTSREPLTLVDEHPPHHLCHANAPPSKVSPNSG